MNAERQQFFVALLAAASLHAVALISFPVATPIYPPARPATLRFELEATAPRAATAVERDVGSAAAAASRQTSAQREETTAPPPTGRRAARSQTPGEKTTRAVDEAERSRTPTSSPPTVPSPSSKQVTSLEPRPPVAPERVIGDTAEAAPDSPRRASRAPAPAPVSPPGAARVPAVARAAPARVAALATDGADRTSQRLRASYEQVLGAWLERHKYYPAVARRRGLEGAGVVRVRIDRGGHVQFGTMERAIGYELLDRAALDMVRRSDPFPRMPDRLSGDHFEFVVPIEYRQID